MDQHHRLNRRKMMKRTSGVLLGTPLLCGLLAACVRAGSSDDPETSINPDPQVRVEPSVTASAASATPTTTAQPTEAPWPTATPFGDYDWETLRRPLDLPVVAPGDECPWTEANNPDVMPVIANATGQGPIYISSSSFTGASYIPLQDDGWSRYKRLIVSSPDYSGPFLIRAQQLDGDTPVRFQNYDGAMQAFDSVTTLPGSAELHVSRGLGAGGIQALPGARLLGGYTMLKGPGCYAYQIDGIDFSQVIVFEFVADQPVEIHPALLGVILPVGLQVTSAVDNEDGQVHLAFESEDLRIRLSASASTTSAPQPPDASWHIADTVIGQILWKPYSEQPWPSQAIWDDGENHYELDVVWRSPNATSWSLDALRELVIALATFDGK